jgi:uncharacterized protein (TIGR03067 family)
MRRFWAIGTVTLALAIGASTWAGDADKEKAKLQGSWTVTKVMIRCEDKSKDFGGFGAGATCTFAGDKVTMKFGTESHEGTFKIVDGKKKPMQIDLSLPKQMDQKAIFEIDGDTLKIATGEKGTDRPSAFDAKDIMVMTFKKNSN